MENNLKLKEAYENFAVGAKKAMLAEAPLTDLFFGEGRLYREANESFSKMYECLSFKECEAISALIGKQDYLGANTLFGQWLGFVDAEGNIKKEDEDEEEESTGERAIETLCELTDIIEELIQENGALKAENARLRKMIDDREAKQDDEGEEDSCDCAFCRGEDEDSAKSFLDFLTGIFGNDDEEDGEEAPGETEGIFNVRHLGDASCIEVDGNKLIEALIRSQASRRQ